MTPGVRTAVGSSVGRSIDYISRHRGHLSAFVGPVGVPLAFLLALSFSTGVSVHAVLRSLITATSVAVILTAALGLLLRDIHRGSVAVLLLFALSACLNTPVRVALWAVTVALAVAWDRLPSRRIAWSRVTSAISTFVTVLLVLILVPGLTSGQLAADLASLRQGGGLPPADDSRLIDPGKPDIYVLLLDGYARPDTLQSTFGYDDGPFLDQLAGRGFDFSADSHSNYPVTAQTLASMFNLAYLDDIPALANVKSGDPAFDGQYLAAINDNAVFSLMRSEGYQIVTTGSGWEQLAVRQSDVYLDGDQLTTYEWSVLKGSGLATAIGALAPSWAGDQMRGRVDATLAEIDEVALTPTPRPRLVFAHVLSPHPPFVYGPNGEHLQVDPTNVFYFDWVGAAADPASVAEYIGQIDYINAQVLPVVDTIMQAARRPTVIVLMSDHGSRLTTPRGTTLMAPEADRNFFATLTPGHAGLFGSSPTPVNLFAQLANAYLGTNRRILEDRSYISTWGDPLEPTELPPDKL
jgi:hypothetical protein